MCLCECVLKQHSFRCGRQCASKTLLTFAQQNSWSHLLAAATMWGEQVVWRREITGLQTDNSWQNVQLIIYLSATLCGVFVEQYSVFHHDCWTLSVSQRSATTCVLEALASDPTLSPWCWKVTTHLCLGLCLHLCGVLCVCVYLSHSVRLILLNIAHETADLTQAVWGIQIKNIFILTCCSCRTECRLVSSRQTLAVFQTSMSVWR